ncbi:MAG: cell division protein FtsA [Verrucomicrobia bacterium]|jgi:cell division protein FtsA|nr:cell division protein FtsA [Verrucomicrobiota bacterium]OQC67890.1 MAG: Cell division protein FtsA [Verrucomicrobia bacterium ADurb.Bin006]MDI9382419.1 cell division protein FtsA [Verrucomicrobiota bacterium]NMD19102.1 cell division protein FtsA [Verrucomicrobiota bacterium]HNU98956.1 cell division protein FtsA [Verrucomicrobiota bacterium]
MFNNSTHLIVGLEVGTSKVCAVVGDVSPEGALSIVGLGQARSRGTRKGEIVDASAVIEDVRYAIAEAEQMADVEIRSVYLGVTGSHIRSFNNRGRHTIPSVDRDIGEDDVRDVIKNAKAINLPADRHTVHVVRQHFIVDSQDGVLNPVGMVGAQIEVDVHVIHGITNRLQNPIRAVKSLQLEVEDIVFNGIASSLAVLTPQDKELGALVIDLGAGVTEYTVYADGIIKHTGVLAVGGDHVTNDLAYGLKISMSRAEALKIEHGSALVDMGVRGRTVELPNDFGLPERSINLEHLRRIMSARLEEVFEIIAAEVERAGLLDSLRAGVFLCGGGSRTPDTQKLGERVFGLPVAIGRTKTISGLVATLDQPEFATGIGLAKFGSFQHGQNSRRRPWTSRLKSALTQMWTDS